MWKLTAAAGLFLWAGSVLAAPSIDEFAKDFHREFQQKMQKSRVPGAVYVIVKNDRIVRVGAYGVRAVGSKTPVDANTIFRLASVSKTFAGALASQIEHEGRFDWNDRVTRYVPGLQFRSQAMTAQLKVEHLLGQSAGLVDNAFDELIEAGQTPAQILPKFRNINPRCVPGRCYGYQNVLFSQIETVLLKSTGQPYEKLLEQRIFRPLQMHTASVGYAGFLASKNRAMPHVRTQKGWAQTKVLPTYYRVNPAAGVNASAMDMGKWLIARLGHRPQVLSASVLDDVHTPRVKTTDNLQGRTYGAYVSTAHYGLGVRAYQFGKHTVYHHGGLVRGYRTDMSYSPDAGLGVVVLMNAQTNAVAELGSYFWHKMLDTPAQAVPPPPKKAPKKQVKKLTKKPQKQPVKKKPVPKKPAQTR
jgi:beta-lactamase class C